MNFETVTKNYGLKIANGLLIKNISGFNISGKYCEETIQYKPTESKTIKDIVYNNFPNLYDLVRDKEGKQGIKDLISWIEMQLNKD